MDHRHQCLKQSGKNKTESKTEKVNKLEIALVVRCITR